MRTIVIAPKETHKFLFDKYRRDDVFADVKFYTKEDVLRNLTYSYTNDAVKYLIGHLGYSYEMSKIILKSLVQVPIDKDFHDKKLKELQNIKKVLITEGLLVKNEYFEYELSQSEIDVYYYPKTDFVLNKLDLSRINFVEPKLIDHKVIYSFETVEDELFYVLNNVCSLISNGVEPNKIKIANISQDYELEFIRMCGQMGLKVNNGFRDSALACSAVRYFFNHFEEGMLSTDLEEFFKDYLGFEYIDQLINKIKEFKIPELNIDKQRKVYEDLFGEYKLDYGRYKSAIQLVNEPFAAPDEYLFILNVSQSNFPTYRRDDEYLSDEELKLIRAEGVGDANNSLKYQMSVALQQDSHLILSFPRNFAGQVTFESPFVKDLDLKVVYNPRVDDIFGEKEFRYKFAHVKDLERKFLLRDKDFKDTLLTSNISDLYQSYDFQPGEIPHYLYDQLLEFSYSSFTKYQKCAFSYYLSKILRLDSSSRNVSNTYGSIYHEVLENIESPKSYDVLFQEALDSKIASNITHNNPLTPREIGMINNLKEVGRDYFNYVKEFERQVTNPIYLREAKFKDITDKEIGVKVTGSIDKAIIFGPNQEYYAVIDYKTGKEKFKPELVQYGLSNQLPFYGMMAPLYDYSKDEHKANRDKKTNLKGKELVGFYIQTIPSTDWVFDPKNTRLEGRTLADKDVIPYLDSTFTTGEQKFVPAPTLKEGGFSKSAKVWSRSEFDNAIKTTKDLVKEARDKIINNEFPVNPKLIKMKNVSCEYCDFKDICFVDARAEIVLDNCGEEDDG